MFTRPFQWQPAEGLRHATRDPFPRPGISFTTLCGVEVTPVDENFVELGGRWLDPTCWVCEAAWRKHEGLPAVPCRSKNKGATS